MRLQRYLNFKTNLKLNGMNFPVVISKNRKVVQCLFI